MTRPPKLAVGVALALGLLSLPARAAAQAAAEPGKEAAPTSSADPKRDASTVAAARALAQQGVRLAESGDCAAALEKLERAEALVHSAIVAEQLATCYVAQGRLVEALELYRGVLRDGLPAQPSPAQRRAYERAEHELSAQRPRLATLVVQVEGAETADDLAVLVDGKELPRALLGAERLSDPGEHHVVASASAHRAARADVTLAPGERRELSLSLEPLAASAAPVTLEEPARAEPKGIAAPSEAPGRSGHALRVGGYALWGSGALALAAGAGFGVRALRQKHALDDRCVASNCPEGERSAIDDAQRSGNVATAALAGGAALVVTGTVLYVLGRRAPGLRRSDRPALGITSDGRRTTATLHLVF